MKKLPNFPIGAVELILECQQLLAGQRQSLSPRREYTAQRRLYWQMQAKRPTRAFGPAQPGTRVA